MVESGGKIKTYESVRVFTDETVRPEILIITKNLDLARALLLSQRVNEVEGKM